MMDRIAEGTSVPMKPGIDFTWPPCTAISTNKRNTRQTFQSSSLTMIILKLSDKTVLNQYDQSCQSAKNVHTSPHLVHTLF